MIRSSPADRSPPLPNTTHGYPPSDQWGRTEGGEIELLFVC